MYTNVNLLIFTFVNMKNSTSLLYHFMEEYPRFQVKEISGRYITYQHIKPLLEKLDSHFEVKEIGRSANGNPVHSIAVGQGPVKILAWSQMHGNETTTTKAIFDILQAFQLFPEDPLVKMISEQISLIIIPMLNPDGASNYTRENARGTDLNRDALRLREPESKLLRKIFMEVNPDFCLNLHDQRTTFSAGPFPYPATLSFLTPAMDENREIFPERKISMQVIAAIVADIKPWLPDQLGRYSDDYNPNCTGDTFQSLGKPTILFECGHFPEDYQRETTRKYMTAALFSCLGSIASGSWKQHHIDEYLDIPENEKLFYDLILRDAHVNGEIQDVAIQFKEKIENGGIIFEPCIAKLGKSLSFYGHKEINCDKNMLTVNDGDRVTENVIVHNMYLNNEVLANNYQII